MVKKLLRYLVLQRTQWNKHHTSFVNLFNFEM